MNCTQKHTITTVKVPHALSRSDAGYRLDASPSGTLTSGLLVERSGDTFVPARHDQLKNPTRLATWADHSEDGEIQNEEVTFLNKKIGSVRSESGVLTISTGLDFLLDGNNYKSIVGIEESVQFYM